MKLPPSSALASIALANIPLISASAILNSAGNEGADLSAADTGILSLTTNHLKDAVPSFVRHLEDCPSYYCSPAICGCWAQYGDVFAPCSQLLLDVCTGSAGTIDNCIRSEYADNEFVTDAEYYRNRICPFAACRVEGGSFQKCACEANVNFCNIYKNKEGYFAELLTASSCPIANCCMDKDDDDGWKSCLAITIMQYDDDTGASTFTTVTDTTDEATNESIDSTGSDAEVEDVSSPPPPPSNANWMTTPSILVLTFGAFIGWFAA